MWRALCLGKHSLIVILAPASINICCLTCSITFELNGLYYKMWQSGQHWLGLEGIVNSRDSLYCYFSYFKDWVMPRIFKPKLVESLPFSTTAVFSFSSYLFISPRPGFSIFSVFSSVNIWLRFYWWNMYMNPNKALWFQIRSDVRKSCLTLLNHTDFYQAGFPFVMVSYAQLVWLATNMTSRLVDALSDEAHTTLKFLLSRWMC